jgi:hypothetical protein
MNKQGQLEMEVYRKTTVIGITINSSISCHPRTQISGIQKLDTQTLCITTQQKQQKEGTKQCH